MCGCGGSTLPAVPPQQQATVPGEAPVVVTQIGPSAPGYFWTGPPGYGEPVVEPAPATDE